MGEKTRSGKSHHISVPFGPTYFKIDAFLPFWNQFVFFSLFQTTDSEEKEWWKTVNRLENVLMEYRKLCGDKSARTHSKKLHLAW